MNNIPNRPSRTSRRERRHELLGAYDLMQRITLYGPNYLNAQAETAVLVHERSHSIIGNVTTYGSSQKALAFLCAKTEGRGDALAARFEGVLDLILDQAFYADEGFAMARERDISTLLGYKFDPASMPDDYAEALARYDALLQFAEPSSTGHQILLLQGLAEAVFNTSILSQVAPADLFDSSVDLHPMVTGIQSPDARLDVLQEICADPSVLARIETRLQELIEGRIQVDGQDSSIDEAVCAAYAITGVCSDQQLRLLYLAASFAAFDVLNELRPDIFEVGPADAIAQNLPFLNSLHTEAANHGITLPQFRGVRTRDEERLAENTLYAPQDEQFDVAWALPSLVARVASKSKLFFFNSPHKPKSEPPPDLPLIEEMLFLTPFGINLQGDTAEIAYSRVQLMVPIENADEPACDTIYRHIIDDVILIEADDICLDQFVTLEQERVKNLVGIVPDTDIRTIEACLAQWQSAAILGQARLVVSLGPIHYYQVPLHNRPRVILRVPHQVAVALKKGGHQLAHLLPSASEPWEPVHIGYLEQTLCHLIEAGAFFGPKRKWHDDFIDDLATLGITPEFHSFTLAP